MHYSCASRICARQNVHAWMDTIELLYFLAFLPIDRFVLGRYALHNIDGCSFLPSCQRLRDIVEFVCYARVVSLIIALFSNNFPIRTCR